MEGVLQAVLMRAQAQGRLDLSVAEAHRLSVELVAAAFSSEARWALLVLLAEHAAGGGRRFFVKPSWRRPQEGNDD